MWRRCKARLRGAELGGSRRVDPSVARHQRAAVLNRTMQLVSESRRLFLDVLAGDVSRQGYTEGRLDAAFR